MTRAEAEAIWREHADRAWNRFRTCPRYHVMTPPTVDISFRKVDAPERLVPREVITIVHEVEDWPSAGRRGWRVKVGPWIVAEGSRPVYDFVRERAI